MISEKGLRELWISQGYTQETISKAIGLHVRTFRNRIKNGRLTTSDVDKLINILDIKNPNIFFYPECYPKGTEDNK